MRSLRYVSGGKPHNMDDCIDYAEKVKDKGKPSVLVELLTEEFASLEWVLDEFYARFEWTFPDKQTAKYKTKFGGCFSHETGERQKLSVDNANYRLDEVYERLKFKGIDVKEKCAEEQKDQALPHWDYSVLSICPKKSKKKK